MNPLRAIVLVLPMLAVQATALATPPPVTVAGLKMVPTLADKPANFTKGGPIARRHPEYYGPLSEATAPSAPHP